MNRNTLQEMYPITAEQPRGFSLGEKANPAERRVCEVGGRAMVCSASQPLGWFTRFERPNPPPTKHTNPAMTCCTHPTPTPSPINSQPLREKGNPANRSNTSTNIRSRAKPPSRKESFRPCPFASSRLCAQLPRKTNLCIVDSLQTERRLES